VPIVLIVSSSIAEAASTFLESGQGRTEALYPPAGSRATEPRQLAWNASIRDAAHRVNASWPGQERRALAAAIAHAAAASGEGKVWTGGVACPSRAISQLRAPPPARRSSRPARSRTGSVAAAHGDQRLGRVDEDHVPRVPEVVTIGIEIHGLASAALGREGCRS